MGRPKKVKVEPKAPVAPKVEKAEVIKLRASFTAKDQDGAKVKIVFESEGKTVKEALDGLKDSETGEEYPKGLVALVNLCVKKGGAELTRALSPTRARKILEGKDVVEFENVFRGF